MSAASSETAEGMGGQAAPLPASPSPPAKQWPHGQRRRRRSHGPLPRPIAGRTRLLIGVGSVVVLIAIWQMISSFDWVNPVFASSPWAVVQAARSMISDGTLGTAVASSATLFGVGLLISLVLGIVFGILLGWYPIADAALDPLVSFLYAAPRIALVPIVMLWAGIGFESQVIVVIISGVFPILINVAVGMKTIDRQLATVTHSFGGNAFDVLRSVALPAAIPAIVAGIRQGVVMCLIAVVIAEYFIGETGVGGMIVKAGQTLDSPDAYVGVIIFAATAIVLTSLLRALEKRLDGWRA